MEEKHKIPIPWCVDTKNCTNEQWLIIRNYRNQYSGVKSTTNQIENVNWNYIGVNSGLGIDRWDSIENFGENTKLYTPQEAIDLIQGKQEVKELSQDELLEYARKHYPIGTRYIPAHIEKGINEVIDTNYHGDSMCVYVKSKPIEEDWHEYLCHNGKWATIISLPEIKDEIPEYVECTESSHGYFIKGNHYKVIDSSNINSVEIICNIRCDIYSPKTSLWVYLNNNWKPSTKKAYDAQNQPKENYKIDN